MIAITKTMIALSAAMSAGLFAVYDVVGSHSEPSPAAQVSQRFPAAGEMFAPLTVKPSAAFALPKGDRLQAATDNCTRQDWPYIAQSCLVSADGKPTRTIARVITVERRLGEAASELTRVSLTTVANR